MKKRFFQIALAAVLSVSCVITGVNVNAASLSQDGYNIEKVSHTDRGAGETDGILPLILWEKKTTVTKAMYGPA